MSKIFKQGLNWVIVDFISNVNFTDEVLNTVTDHNWADFTSAKGDASQQHYIINPSWLPVENHKVPDGWDNLKNTVKNIIRPQLINYGLMPVDWQDLEATSAWTVIGKEGSFHTAHEHGPDKVCSIIYTQVPENQKDPQGQIFFIMHSDPYSHLSQPNFRVFTINPQKGMIVIFPSWMVHGVYPQGPGIRQTLNIDFIGVKNTINHIPQAPVTRYN
jgi:hypothetical protein